MNLIRRLGKKACAAVVAAGLVVGSCLPAVAAETTCIKGTFTFAAHDNDHDLTDSYVYSDSFFQKSAYETNIHLAVMSMILASSSISSKDVDYPQKSRNIQDLLNQLGFQNIEVNEDYQQKMTQNSMGAIAAYKDLGDSVLLALVPRSAGYEAEWGGNFNLGNSGLHAGFQTGRDIIFSFAREYVSRYAEAFAGKTVKVWTAGYSRGAAVANLIGAALVDDSKTYIGLEVSPENVYDYTFGTPFTAATDLNPRDEKYNNIHNYYADYDAVAMLPMAVWGFDRYGKDELLDVHNADTKARMLTYLAQTNAEVYKNYTTSEDPDNFQGMKLGVTEDGSISIVPDPESTTNERDFVIDRLQAISNTIIPDRTTYAEEYQQAVTEATALLIGEDDDTVAAFTSGAAGSKSAKPLAVMLFLYNWVEQYINNKNLAGAPLEENWREELIPNLSGDSSTGGDDQASEEGDPTDAAGNTDGNTAPDGNADTDGNAAPDGNADTGGNAAPDENADTDGNAAPDGNAAGGADVNTDVEPSSEAEALKEALLGSEAYQEIYSQVTSDTLEEDYNGGQPIADYSGLLTIYRQIAGNYMKNVLSAGLEAIGYSGESLEQHPLIQGNAPQALSLVAAQALFGTEDTLSLDGAINKIKTAATCMGNNFLRVHNNEVILSWLRAMDTEPIDDQEDDGKKDDSQQDDSSKDDTGKKDPITPEEVDPSPDKNQSDTGNKNTTVGQASSVNAVKTGDSAQIWLWSLLLAGSVIMIGVTGGIKRTKR